MSKKMTTFCRHASCLAMLLLVGCAELPNAPRLDAGQTIPIVEAGTTADTSRAVELGAAPYDVAPPPAGDASAALCAAVDCAGHGRCVVVDGVASCACDAGYYRVELGCLADPCEGGAAAGRCYYVDSVTGNDSAAGTKARPWATLTKVRDSFSSFGPGDYVLIRRGSDFSGVDLIISGVEGAAAAPLTFGAYGPLSDPRPRLRKVTIRESASYITLRDMEIAHNTGGPCVPVNAAHVIIQDNVVHHCSNNGIHFGANSTYGTMIDNLVYEVNANDALVIHNPMEPTDDYKVGDHHWIVDNRVPGPVDEQPIDVATGTDTIKGARDIKIVGNVVGNGNAGCIVTGHGTSVVWIVGNTLGNCPRAETAGPLRVGGSHGENSGTHYQIRGNVIFWNLMSSSFSTEAPAAPLAIVEQNTIVTVVGKRTTWANKLTAGSVHFNRNLLWTTGTRAHVGFDGDPQQIVGSMDDNWYVPAGDPACNVNGQSLSAWQQSSGFDQRSGCGAVPGLALPTEADAKDFSRWDDPAFLGKFVPDESWPGCGRRVGAFDCQGKRRVRFEPFSDYEDNDGYGWRGPLIVRQRYPLR